MPVSLPAEKSVHNGRKNSPERSSGTPRTTLPNAAPKKTANRPLAEANTTSHSGCHTRLRI